MSITEIFYFILSIILIIILSIVLNDNNLIKSFYKNYKYWVEDSTIDYNFKTKVINIINNSNWNKKYSISHTNDKASSDIQIYLVPDDKLDYLHTNKKYYPNGKQIRFSYTINQKIIYINAKNWLYSVDESGLSLEQYKEYVINHELGHALGYDHIDCNDQTAKNKICPVMYQSTIGPPKGFISGYN